MMSAPDKKIAARDALLAAAQSLFIEKGYNAVSTRELAEAAGVNLAAIQYHFGSKGKLFAEVVRTAMHGSKSPLKQELISSPVHSRDEAMVKLCQFIDLFLHDLLQCEGPQPCRMMLREMFTDTSDDTEMFEALVTSVVNDFSRPGDEFLQRVVGLIDPSIPKDKLFWATQSVIGQCFFYLTHRPFLLRMRGIDCAKSPHIEEAMRQVSTFSLRALGCSAAEIGKAVDGAMHNHEFDREKKS